MTTKNETSQINANTLRFLEGLSTSGLNRLLTSRRYMADVIRYAQHSDVLTQRIRQILKDDYSSLSAKEQEHADAVRSRVLFELHAQERLGMSERPEEVIPRESEFDPVSLPQEILDALSAFARRVSSSLGTERLRDRVLGFSKPVAASAQAASGEAHFVAKLTRPQSGLVDLEVDRAGYGVLRGRFDQPKAVSVLVYDSVVKEIIEIGEQGTELLPTLELKSGSTLKRIRLNVPPNWRSADDLRILILSEQSK